MTYSTTKFEVATSNGLGGDAFTRNVTDGQTDDGPTLTGNYYTLFLKKKAGIKSFITAGPGSNFVYVYYVYASNEGSGESANQRKLAEPFVAR